MNKKYGRLTGEDDNNDKEAESHEPGVLLERAMAQSSEQWKRSGTPYIHVPT